MDIRLRSKLRTATPGKKATADYSAMFVIWWNNKTTLILGVVLVSLLERKKLAALFSALFLLCNFLFLSHWASLPGALTDFGQSSLIFYFPIFSGGVAS